MSSDSQRGALRGAGLLFIGLAAAALLSACAAPGPGRARTDVATDAAPHCGAQHYPFHALENDLQGDVVLRADLDASGQVAAATLLVPGPSRYLDSAALDGVRSCRFAAAAAPRKLDVLVAYRFRNASEFPPQGVIAIAARPPVPQDAAPPSHQP